MSVPIQVRFVPRFAGGRKGLLGLTPGPIAEADTSQGLEHVGWALWVDEGNVLRMARLDTQPPVNAPSPDHMADVQPALIDHLSFCFNQNARRVIVWEQAGSCTISFIEPGPPETARRVTWAGRDPLFFFDGWFLNVGRGAPTDIIVFYLSLDRRTVHWRRQGEHFGTEHVWGTLPEPASLDATGRHAHQVAVYFSTLAEPEGAGALISDPYPFESLDTMALSVGLMAGVYTEVVVIRDPIMNTANLTGALHTGAYTEVVVTRDPIMNTANLTGALTGGEYVLRTTGGGEYIGTTTLAAGLIGGNYAPG